MSLIAFAAAIQQIHATTQVTAIPGTLSEPVKTALFMP
jgi:hypothetical protein